LAGHLRLHCWTGRGQALDHGGCAAAPHVSRAVYSAWAGCLSASARLWVMLRVVSGPLSRMCVSCGELALSSPHPTPPHPTPPHPPPRTRTLSLRPRHPCAGNSATMEGRVDVWAARHWQNPVGKSEGCLRTAWWVVRWRPAAAEASIGAWVPPPSPPPPPPCPPIHPCSLWLGDVCPVVLRRWPPAAKLHFSTSRRPPSRPSGGVRARRLCGYCSTWRGTTRPPPSSLMKLTPLRVPEGTGRSTRPAGGAWAPPTTPIPPPPPQCSCGPLSYNCGPSPGIA
jgi:hypothetical protein